MNGERLTHSLCVDCRYVGRINEEYYCEHPRAPKHPVYGGASVAPCKRLRGMLGGTYYKSERYVPPSSDLPLSTTVQPMHKGEEICGLEGVWFTINLKKLQKGKK